MSDKLLYVIVGGFAFGILLRSYLEWGLSLPLWFSLIALVLLLYALVFSSPHPPLPVGEGVPDQPRRRQRVEAGGRGRGQIKSFLILVSIFLFALSLGVLRFHIAAHKSDPLLDQLVGGRIKIQGLIVDEPDERERNTKLIVSLDKTNIKALVTSPPYPKFSYGDEVIIEGLLVKPQMFETDVGKVFDYVSYLAKDGILYEIKYATVELLSSGHGSFIRRNLFALKHTFLKKMSRVIPEPESALAGGVILGTKQSLGKNLKQDFIDTGIIHIVVLSGYNITIVADAIMRALARFPQMLGISLGGVAIILFALMTGAGATIVRASIMAILVLLARATGRSYQIGRALLLAGFLMLVHNPWILVFDISFQLSFLATIGLIYLAPHFEKYVRFLPKLWNLRGIFAATLATQLFVLPFILYKIGTLSIVAVVVNLLILPFVAATMFFGFITGVVGLISVVLSLPFAWISYALLHYEIKVVEFFASLPFASIAMKSFPLFLVILIYLAIGWYLWKQNKRQNLTSEQ